MTIKHLAILLLLTLGISSCVSVTEQAQRAQNQPLSFTGRTQGLTAITRWNLKGLLAIRQNRDAVTANLQWQQQNDRYHILLFGPLGAYSYEITGTPGNVVLASANGQRFKASSAEALLAKQAGWQLPVSNLFYWIRGLQVPGIPAQKQLDRFNHLTVLNQQGWTIRYLRYTSVGHIDVPSKIFLDNRQLQVKIIISEWQLN